MKLIQATDLPPIKRQRNLLRDSLGHQDRKHLDYLLATGKTTSEAARAMRISVKTVEAYQGFARARYRRSDVEE